MFVNYLFLRPKLFNDFCGDPVKVSIEMLGMRGGQR